MEREELKNAFIKRFNLKLSKTKMKTLEKVVADYLRFDQVDKIDDYVLIDIMEKFDEASNK